MIKVIQKNLVEILGSKQYNANKKKKQECLQKDLPKLQQVYFQVCKEKSKLELKISHQSKDHKQK